MADILVRRLDEAVKQRLKERAERHGRSLEAEVREILMEATCTEPTAPAPEPKGLGTQLAEAFDKIGLTPEELRLFEEGLRQARANDFGRDPPDFS
jgi:plasmid stability protein